VVLLLLLLLLVNLRSPESDLVTGGLRFANRLGLANSTPFLR
jgi:hypothetical protein